MLSVLKDATKKIVGLDFNEIDPDSIQKVMVVCNKCGEIFQRERCRLNEPHMCPRQTIDGRVKCLCCMKYYNKSDLSNSMCIKCIDYCNKIISYYKSNCNKDHLVSSWIRQAGRCYYNNDRLGPESKVVLFNDELDPSPNNIMWVNSRSTNSDHFVRMEFKRLVSGAKLPFRKRMTDVGYDIASIQDIDIPPHGSADVETGIAVSIPAGYYFTVDGRSSMSQNGIIPFRGIIDSTYCGHLKVALMNVSDDPYHILKNDRIAQIILHKQIHADFVEIDEFSPEYSARGEGGQAGWGSSGR